MDRRDRRSSAKAFPDWFRRSHPKIPTGGADLSSPLCRGMVDGGALGRLSVRKIRRVLRAALIREVRTLYLLSPAGRSGGTTGTSISVALLRRSAHGRSDERVDADDYGNLRQTIAETTRRAFACDRSLEVRLQESEVDR